MKKLICIVFALISLCGYSQHNWIQNECCGFDNGSEFYMTQQFQGKFYVISDSSSHILLYSSPDPQTIPFVHEYGLSSVLQPVNESLFTGTCTGPTAMFFGSYTNYDTTGGVTGTYPQIYRYDGSTFAVHGTMNFATLPPDNQILSGSYPSICNLIQYSATGANDTLYAFVNSGSSNAVSVWKAPVNQLNPTWVNSSNFSLASGITSINDTKIWHNKLYVSLTSYNNGGMILRTTDGVTWDTVTTALSLGSSVLGTPPTNTYFGDLEVFKDTLLVNSKYAPNGVALIYTADSLLQNQTWNYYLDSVACTALTTDNDDYYTMKAAAGKLWLMASRRYMYNPSIYMIGNKNAQNKDTILSSTLGTGLDASNLDGGSFSMQYFNNRIYAVGHQWMGARSSSAANIASPGYEGVIYSFLPVNPTASFIDSVYTGTGFCEGNSIYVVSTSTNASSYNWYVNGTQFSSNASDYFSESTAGNYTVTLIAYNGTQQSTFKDSVTKVITIYPNPFAGPASASSYTICQGQSDSLFVNVTGGAAPYTIDWNNVTDNLTYHGSDTTVITLYTVPSFSPYVYMYVTIKDTNLCGPGNPPPPLYIYVNPSDSLSGTVVDTLLNPVNSGKVFLFRLNPLNPQPGDTAGIYNLNATGTYVFPSLYYGDYIAKAVADTTNPLYATSVGTYYSNLTYPFQWDSATVILHHGCTNSNQTGNDIKILQIPAASLSGPGIISGYVSKDSSYTGARYGNGLFSPMGAPLKGVDVKLGKNPGGSPAARTTTGSDGSYTFDHIPVGNYRIYIDIPNYGMDSVRVVNLTPTDTVSIHNDYYVDSTMIRVVPVDTVMTSICSGDSILLPGGYYQTLAGTYIDTLTTGFHDSVMVTMVSIKPLPTLTLTTSSDTICQGGTFMLTAAGTSGSYAWGANAGSATTATVSLNPAATDTYVVTGTLNGCSVTKSIVVVVKNCADVQHISRNGFAVYPNPAIDKLAIEAVKAGTMKLINITGQVVLERNIEAGRNDINVSSLPAGVYELSINSGGEVTNTKLMISK